MSAQLVVARVQCLGHTDSIIDDIGGWQVRDQAARRGRPGANHDAIGSDTARHDGEHGDLSKGFTDAFVNISARSSAARPTQSTNSCQHAAGAAAQ